MKKKIIRYSVLVLILISLGFLIAHSIRKVRQSSLDKSIQCNLRQVASAAQQYFLEYGKESCSFDELIGPGKYLSTVRVRQGENYRDIFPIRKDFKEISVTTESGHVITYSFR